MATRILLALALLASAFSPLGAQPLTKVTVGVTNSATDVGFFIAHKKNYFRDEGIDAEFIVFDSAARMIAPLASGELDVAAGGISNNPAPPGCNPSGSCCSSRQTEGKSIHESARQAGAEAEDCRQDRPGAQARPLIAFI